MNLQNVIVLTILSTFTAFTYATVIEIPLEQELRSIKEGKSILLKKSDDKGVLNELIAGLKKMHAPYEYIQQAQRNINGIIFKELPEDVYGAYNRLTKTIYLPMRLRDSATGRLLPIKKLGVMSLGTIYHEMWHAYLDTVARPTRNSIYRFWKRQSQSIYTNHQEQFHNEAYGIYLDQIMIGYVRFRRIFEKKTPELRERLRNSPELNQLYRSHFSEKVNGYYIDRWRRRPVFTNVNLPFEDRHQIVEDLLRDRPPFEYELAYPEDYFK